ncbi:hypothetical protein L228DRAFT_266339 [Xylona heveae TC161]|uniref:PHD-type domain-containing protein n=1 Tax=Xylona heveae (strain CBS 132557 / TC161) TaxID=1328760 RepID=A0A165HV72_XYLHT|nr:hypothetical protein L228DRAFT_266339 [Xylona heveae TC161]KZF23965.1 hypothetical protein L228DRAFT_266339 [Xylona heveae TC161]
MDPFTDHSSLLMQAPATPPPSGPRRKTKQAQLAPSSKQPVPGSRKMSMPPSSASKTQSHRKKNGNEAPQLDFTTGPSLQFSPETFPFPMSGPATAPIFPDTKSFWDQNAVNLGLSIPETDPFFDPQKEPQNYPWMGSAVQTESLHSGVAPMLQLGLTSQHQYLPQATSLGGGSSNTRLDPSPLPASFDLSCSQAPSLDFATADSAFNPNMLLSFSQSPNHSLRPASAMNRPRSRVESRRPYHHQTLESQRQKDLDRNRELRIVSGDAAQGPSLTQHGAFSKVLDKPGLKRSMTDGQLRAKLEQSRSRCPVPGPPQSTFVPGGNGWGPRRPSPLKSQTPSISQSVARSDDNAKGAVSLAVDQNGRAKVVVADSPSPAKMRKRSNAASAYSLYDDDSDSATDVDEPYVLSRASSFSYSQPARRASNLGPALAEFYPKSRSPVPDVSRIQLGPGLSAHRKLRTASFRTGSPTKRGRAGLDTPDPLRMRKLSLSDDAASEAETITEFDEHKSSGDAQHALKKVLEERSKRKVSMARKTPLRSYSPSKHRLPPMSLPKAANFVPAPYPGMGAYQFPSPTTESTITEPQLPTPTHPHSDIQGLYIRCICDGGEADGAPMIQCDACAKWLHVQCVGVDQQRPPIYVCSYCAIQPPIVDGFHDHDFFAQNAPFTSPLAQKSLRSRN